MTVAVLLAAIGGIGGILGNARTELPPKIDSIAILPLRNVGDPSQEQLVDGLSLGLTTTVAQLTRATVTSHDSAMRYKTSSKSPQQIGRELGVDAVATGAARRSGADVVVGLELTSVTTGQPLWTKSFRYRSLDLPMAQADLAAGLLGEVDSRRMTSEQRSRLAGVRAVKPEVQEACLKGWLLEKRGNEPELERSISYFQEAIRMDPDYAPAYVGLANGYAKLVIPAREASRLATESLTKALSLDPTLGEAHATLAFVRILDWDWRGAEAEAKRAIELNPNDARAHAQYASVLLTIRRLDEALVEITRVRRLDPLALQGYQFMAWWFFEKKQPDRAIEELRKGIELEPNRSLLHSMLADGYHDVGMYRDALAEYQKTYELSGVASDRAGIAHMLVHLGEPDQARKIVGEIEHEARDTGTSYDVAKIYAALERREEAIKWLELAYEARALDLTWIHLDRDFDWLQSDPRFRDLVKRVRLQQEFQ